MTLYGFRRYRPDDARSTPLTTCVRRLVSVLLVFSMVAGAAGCATWRTVPGPRTPVDPAFADVKPGDELVLTLRDGRRVEVDVERIDGDTLVSDEGVRYARHDIAALQVHRLSAWRTALLVGGIAAAAFVVVGMMIASALNSFWGG